MFKSFLSTIRQYKSQESGASAVEFAFISPLFILMIIATLDLGLFILEKSQIQNLASTVAHYSAERQNTENVDIVAQESYQGDMDNITMETAFQCECADGTVSQCPVDCGDDDYQRRFISVSVNGQFEPLFPYPLIDSPMSLQSSMRVRVD